MEIWFSENFSEKLDEIHPILLNSNKKESKIINDKPCRFRFLTQWKKRIEKAFNQLVRQKQEGEALSGIFGTNAVLITDINLLIQIIAFLLLLTGLVYKAKGKFRIHGSVMGIAVFLHLISFLLAMGPSFFYSFDFFTTDTLHTGVQTMWVHAITGAVALILGIVLVVAWILQSSNVKACIRRR